MGEGGGWTEKKSPCKYLERKHIRDDKKHLLMILNLRIISKHPQWIIGTKGNLLGIGFGRLLSLKSNSQISNTSSVSVSTDTYFQFCLEVSMGLFSAYPHHTYVTVRDFFLVVLDQLHLSPVPHLLLVYSQICLQSRISSYAIVSSWVKKNSSWLLGEGLLLYKLCEELLLSEGLLLGEKPLGGDLLLEVCRTYDTTLFIWKI